MAQQPELRVRTGLRLQPPRGAVDAAIVDEHHFVRPHRLQLRDQFLAYRVDVLRLVQYSDDDRRSDVLRVLHTLLIPVLCPVGAQPGGPRRSRSRAEPETVRTTSTA